MNIYKRIEEIVKNKSNVVVFEVGSNDGQTINIIYPILELSCKSFYYHAFEMVEALAKWSVEACKHEHLTINNVAVSDTSELEKEYNLSVNGAYNGSSSLKDVKNAMNWWPEMKFEKRKTATITIDDYCQQNNINHIDFIWADIQGAEELMIKGMTKMLSNTKYIYTEYNKDLYDGALGVTEIAALLTDFDIIEDYGGDVLFKNNKL